jgi:hypothetical protein
VPTRRAPGAPHPIPHLRSHPPPRCRQTASDPATRTHAHIVP